MFFAHRRGFRLQQKPTEGPCAAPPSEKRYSLSKPRAKPREGSKTFRSMSWARRQTIRLSCPENAAIAFPVIYGRWFCRASSDCVPMRQARGRRPYFPVATLLWAGRKCSYRGRKCSYRISGRPVWDRLFFRRVLARLQNPDHDHRPSVFPHRDRPDGPADQGIGLALSQRTSSCDPANGRPGVRNQRRGDPSTWPRERCFGRGYDGKRTQHSSSSGRATSYPHPVP
jgi:hypothetical protein